MSKCCVIGMFKLILFEVRFVVRGFINALVALILLLVFFLCVLFSRVCVLLLLMFEFLCGILFVYMKCNNK